mmetsp:Transcript_27842/g.76604  ORF Transcript_27842/g.76604 Transcript_27842/m.76604 type:complete len:244 (+) Transcript_27842:349-1080(+)
MAKSRGRLPAGSRALGSAPAATNASVISKWCSRVASYSAKRADLMESVARERMLPSTNGFATVPTPSTAGQGGKANRLDAKMESGSWPLSFATKTSAPKSSNNLMIATSHAILTAQQSGGSTLCSQKGSLADSGSASHTLLACSREFRDNATSNGGIVTLCGASGGLKGSTGGHRHPGDVSQNGASMDCGAATVCSGELYLFARTLVVATRPSMCTNGDVVLCGFSAREREHLAKRAETGAHA